MFLGGDVADQVANLKRRPGPDLHVYGSANLMQTLLRHDLVDAFWLRIHPITLGRGKRLFDGGAIPAAFRVTESRVTSTGVVLVSYERAGAIPTFRACGRPPVTTPRRRPWAGRANTIDASPPRTRMMAQNAR